jgi:3D (Asp-Asp-Asp) domain-containing protein
MRGRIVSLAISAAGALALGGCAQASSPPPRHSGHLASAAKRVLPARPPEPKKTTVAATPTVSAPPSASRCTSQPPPIAESPITRRQWLGGVVITEYYPAPARWFTGRSIAAPGLSGAYPADWLYSARGLAMEGQGVDEQGRPVHIAALGSTGWVNAAGQPTLPVCLGKWTNGFPAWLRGGWRNARGAVTFPLASGGWSNGAGTRTLDYGGVTFEAGPALPLRYYHSIAVDPRLIPLGSRVYIPAYRGLGGGWFMAQDTGGAIRGRHVDVYRPAPASPDDLGRYMTNQRILVIPPA